MDIEANLKAYLGAREPTARYASFDYCFNHFHRRRGELTTPGGGLELSCLHLAFYLASWGMLRGSSVRLQRSVKHYAPVVEVVEATDPDLWRLDADRYSEDSIELVLETARQIRSAFPEGASDILVSKIMLGVFGCVPAFDSYFKKGFRVSTFGKKALRRVGEFYAENQAVIDAHRVHTLDFETGAETDVLYTCAKMIDMAFFVEGAM